MWWLPDVTACSVMDGKRGAICLLVLTAECRASMAHLKVVLLFSTSLGSRAGFTCEPLHPPRP